MDLRKVHIKVEELKLKKPFVISRGARTVIPIILLSITEGNVVGYGECTPSSRYGETTETEIKKIKKFYTLIENGISRIELRNKFPACAARNAIDMALWDLELKLEKTSIWKKENKEKPSNLPTAYTISIDTAEKMAEEAHLNSHFNLIKIKLAGDIDDLKRIELVRTKLPKNRLILDANESIHPKNLNKLISISEKMNIELIEQPVKKKYDKEIKRINTKIILCADESCRTLSDLKKIINIYDAINIKLDKSGGLTEALLLKDFALQNGLKIMIGCMICSSIGIAAAQLIALDADYIDLDGASFIEKDRENSITYKDGNMSIASSNLWG
jgi:L-Ala-D/L-Glu epimerase